MDIMEIKKKLKYLSITIFTITCFLFVFSFFIDEILPRKYQGMYGFYISLPMLIFVFVSMGYILYMVLYRKINIGFGNLMLSLSPIIIIVKIIVS